MAMYTSYNGASRPLMRICTQLFEAFVGIFQEKKPAMNQLESLWGVSHALGARQIEVTQTYFSMLS